MTRTSILALMLMIVALAMAPAFGQQPGPAAPPPEGRSATRRPDNMPAVSLSFPGGTVREYVDLLRKQLRTEHAEGNIIVKGGAADVSLPPVDLENVSLASAVELLDGHRDVDGGTRLNVRAVRGDYAPVFILEAEKRQGPANEELVHVWNVRQLLSEDLKAEDMLTAIEAALSLLPTKAGAAEIRFHEATALIMARGTGDQVATIEMVVQQLRETQFQQDMERQRREELERAAAMRSDAVARMERELSSIQAELGASKQDRDKLYLELQVATQIRQTLEEENRRQAEEFATKMRQREAELVELRRRLQEKQ